MKKVHIALALTFAITLTLFSSQVFAFSDVKDPYAYAYQIDWLADNGVLSGYADGKFKPNNCVNRAEFLKMLYSTLESNLDDLAAGAGWADYFSDVDTNAWYWKYLRYALQTGSAKGYPDKTFRPDQCVKRVEAVKIAVLDFNGGKVPKWDSLGNHLVDVAHDAWYSPMLDYAHAAGALGLDHTKLVRKGPPGDSGSDYNYFPDAGMTRGEVAYLLFNLKSFKDNGVISNDPSQYNKENGLILYNDERGMLMPRRLADAYRFDGCGKMNDKYALESWYAEWKAAATSAKIDLTKIQDACMSNEMGRLIFIVDEGYMKLSSIYKYTIKGAIQKAGFTGDKAYEIAQINSFGKRNGNFIPLVGEVGDAGCGTTFNYKYYFEKNVLQLGDHKSYCFDEKTGKKVYQ